MPCSWCRGKLITMWPACLQVARRALARAPTQGSGPCLRLFGPQRPPSCTNQSFTTSLRHGCGTSSALPPLAPLGCPRAVAISAGSYCTPRRCVSSSHRRRGLRKRAAVVPVYDDTAPPIDTAAALVSMIRAAHAQTPAARKHARGSQAAATAAAGAERAVADEEPRRPTDPTALRRARSNRLTKRRAGDGAAAAAGENKTAAEPAAAPPWAARLRKSSALQVRIAQKRLLLQQCRRQQAAATPCGERRASAAQTEPGCSRSPLPAHHSLATAAARNPLYFPDYREQVLRVFHQLAEINLALGEKYKTQSYHGAVERLKRGDAIFKLLPPHLKPLPETSAPLGDAAAVQELLEKRAYALDASRPIPGVGDKLRKKIVEILETGDLAELHTLRAKPVIQAIQQLTQVHGFGPRTAMAFYKDHGICTVEELQIYAQKQEAGDVAHTGGTMKKGKGKSGLHLTDAQRLGLRYYTEFQQPIPHSEGRLHEAFLKLRLRKHLGRGYELTVCGSFRRRTATSGDIDVLITPRVGEGRRDADADAEDPLGSLRHVLATFVAALQAERYVEATLAQGPTKFMGVCRLRSLERKGAPGEAPTMTRRFHARRIDIRFVDTASYPAALLYFTGSKNFNVIMRAEAIKKNFILNEYGLFRNSAPGVGGAGGLHEMIGKLAKAQYYSSKKGALNYSLPEAAGAGDDGDENDADEAESGGRKRRRAGKAAPASGKMQEAELRRVLKEVEALRVETRSEEDVFNAIGMDYVAPEDRNV